MLIRYYWFGPQDFADKDLSWKLRITPESAARLMVQYYLPNVNMDNDALKPYAGEARYTLRLLMIFSIYYLSLRFHQ